MENVGAEEPLQQLGFRDRRFRTALSVAAWGIAGILSTTASGLVPNTAHAILYFLFLMAGVVLLLLTVVAQDRQPMADRAAARLEGWIQALFYKEGRA